MQTRTIQNCDEMWLTISGKIASCLSFKPETKPLILILWSGNNGQKCLISVRETWLTSKALSQVHATQNSQPPYASGALVLDDKRQTVVLNVVSIDEKSRVWECR